MRQRRIIGLLVCGLVIGLAGPGVALAQEDAACPALVETALALLEESCAAPGRETACYGHSLVEATFWEPDGNPRFVAPADTIPLAALRTLHTAPIDPARDVWGLAVVNLRADVPEALPGQAVTFLLMGDATLESAVTPAQVEAEEAGPMQTVYFSTNLGEPTCHETPDALVIRNNTGVEVAMTVNGLDVSLASTVMFTLMPDSGRPGRAVMITTLLEGTVTVRYLGFATTLTQPGDSIALALDEHSTVMPDRQPRSVSQQAPVVGTIKGGCALLARSYLGERIDAAQCAAPLRFTLPPFSYYEIGGIGSRCVDMNTIVPGQLLGFQTGIGRWETVDEMRAALAGESATITIDGQPLPVYYEGPTWHTGGPHPAGYGDRARANWRAVPGEHTVSGMWSTGFGHTCTFLVADE